MIDDIKRWLSESPAGFLPAEPWLRWCVAEIERLRAAHVDDQEALFHYRDMYRASGDQRCETCGHWEELLIIAAEFRTHGVCNDEGPSWLETDRSCEIMTRPNGGAGCDNYKRRET